MTATIDSVELAADRALLDWLRAVGERRDLTIPAPPHPRAPALAALLAALSRECGDGEELLAAAHDAARTIDQGVAALLRASGDKAGRSGALATAAVAARTVVERHAETADDLRTFVESFIGSVTQTHGGVARTGSDLSGGLDVLMSAAGPLGEMRNSIAALDEFIAILARLSRHSQLLGVNASIEAAHLGDMGSRFAIVAAELRDLSASTRGSRADVAATTKALRDSTTQISTSMLQARAAAQSATSAAQAADGALSSLTADLRQFAEVLAGINAELADQRRAITTYADTVAAGASLREPRGAAERVRGADDLVPPAATSWRFAPATGAAFSGADSFGHWVAQLRSGGATTAPPADHAPLAAAVRSLIERFDADRQPLLAALRRAAHSAAERRSSWLGLAAGGDRSDQTAALADAQAALARAQRTAERASALSALGVKIRTTFAEIVTLVDAVFGFVTPLSEGFANIDSYLESANAATARADEIVTLIETLSAETDLLSLNAAIEAAHAGELGLGFGVIAEETRSLARSTNDSTTGVSERVIDIGRFSRGLQASIEAARGRIGDILGRSGDARQLIASMSASFEGTSANARTVYASGAEQIEVLTQLAQSCGGVETAADDAGAQIDRGCRAFESIDTRAAALAARGR